MATVHVTVSQWVNFVEVYEVEVEGSVTEDSIMEAAEDGWETTVKTLSSDVVDERILSWEVLEEAQPG